MSSIRMIVRIILLGEVTQKCESQNMPSMLLPSSEVIKSSMATARSLNNTGGGSHQID